MRQVCRHMQTRQRSDTRGILVCNPPWMSQTESSIQYLLFLWWIPLFLRFEVNALSGRDVLNPMKLMGIIVVLVTFAIHVQVECVNFILHRYGDEKTRALLVGRI